MTPQLSLFAEAPEKVAEKERYPWIGLWDWMPVVGGMAQINEVIMPEYGYTYMDEVRILIMNGDDVLCVLDSSRFGNEPYYKDGMMYYCKVNELWPPVYHPRTKENGYIL